MEPMVVIVGEPAPEARPQFASGLKSVEINALVFHRPPQALDEDVVHPATPGASLKTRLAMRTQIPKKSRLSPWCMQNALA